MRRRKRLPEPPGGGRMNPVMLHKGLKMIAEDDPPPKAPVHFPDTPFWEMQEQRTDGF